MTGNVAAIDVRRRRGARIADRMGVRTVRRPLPGGGELDVAYVRDGPRSDLPVLIFPGGPGLASVLPYRRLRANAKRIGLDVVMMEHRGVGLSRTDVHGRDLPRKAMTIVDAVDDAAAILTAENIDQVVVYGTSYGSYLAQVLGVRHPTMVAGMVLDSAMLDADTTRTSSQVLTRLFWEGTPFTQRQANAARRVVSSGAVSEEDAGVVLRFLFELGGLTFVDRMLTLLEQRRGQRLWHWIRRLGARELMTPHPFVVEFDLVGEIAFRELNYAAPPTDGSFARESAFADAAAFFSPFENEPYDLSRELPSFGWSTVVISGDRDIRTPRTVAERIASLLSDAIVVRVHDQGHSTLDTHPALALDIARVAVNGISASGRIMPAALPSDPTGTRSMMHRLISSRLTLSRLAPRGRSWIGRG